MNPSAALAACRFLHDSSAMLVWGASAYIAALVPPSLAGAVARRLRPMAIVAVVVAVATTVSFLPLEAAFIGERWGDALDPAMLRDILFETSVGQAWQLQAAATAILIVVLVFRSHRRLITLASGLLLASVALTGHAVMHRGWLGLAHRVNDVIHLLSAGAWLGALVPLLAILAAIDDPKCRSEADLALRRFSTAGHAAVALVIASGVLNTVLVLGHWPTDWSSPYQAMLAGKVALVAIMVVLAIANRYVFVPRLGRDTLSAVRAISVGTTAELFLAFCVIGLVSVFGMLEPV